MATDEKPPFEKFAMMFWNKQLQDLIKEKNKHSGTVVYPLQLIPCIPTGDSLYKAGT